METAILPKPAQPDLQPIPQMPIHAHDRWDMLWRMLYQLETDNQLLRLELAFYKSQDQRTKWAGQYAEEAVAQVYGLERLCFYGSKGLGRTDQQEAAVTQARFLLYTILHHVLGVPIADLRQYYDNNTRNYLDRWKPIFELIHRPRPITDAKKQQTFDRFAPRYRAAYLAMQAAMTTDGVWLNQYNDPLLGTLL